MAEEISYPIDDMLAIARDVRRFLEQQWQRHNALYLDAHTGYAPVTTSIARALPGAGGRAEALHDELMRRQHLFEQHYAVLFALVDLLETHAQGGAALDNALGAQLEQIVGQFPGPGKRPH